MNKLSDTLHEFGIRDINIIISDINNRIFIEFNATKLMQQLGQDCNWLIAEIVDDEISRTNKYENIIKPPKCKGNIEIPKNPNEAYFRMSFFRYQNYTNMENPVHSYPEKRFIESFEFNYIELLGLSDTETESYKHGRGKFSNKPDSTEKYFTILDVNEEFKNFGIYDFFIGMKPGGFIVSWTGQDMAGDYYIQLVLPDRRQIELQPLIHIDTGHGKKEYSVETDIDIIRIKLHAIRGSMSEIKFDSNVYLEYSGSDADTNDELLKANFLDGNHEQINNNEHSDGDNQRISILENNVQAIAENMEEIEKQIKINIQNFKKHQESTILLIKDFNTFKNNYSEFIGGFKNKQEKLHNEYNDIGRHIQDLQGNERNTSKKLDNLFEVQNKILEGQKKYESRLKGIEGSHSTEAKLNLKTIYEPILKFKIGIAEKQISKYYAKLKAKEFKDNHELIAIYKKISEIRKEIYKLTPEKLAKKNELYLERIVGPISEKIRTIKSKLFLGYNDIIKEEIKRLNVEEIIKQFKAKDFASEFKLNGNKWIPYDPEELIRQTADSHLGKIVEQCIGKLDQHSKDVYHSKEDFESDLEKLVGDEIFQFVETHIKDIEHWHNSLSNENDALSAADIQKIKLKIVELASIEEISVDVGKTLFNDELHIESEAVNDTGYVDNTVLGVVYKGYRISWSGKVIRKCGVKVNYRS